MTGPWITKLALIAAVVLLPGGLLILVWRWWRGRAIEQAAARAVTGVRHVMPDRREIALFADVMSVRIVCGSIRHGLTEHEVTPAAGRALLRGLLRWWLVTCWCGLRERPVRRALQRARDQAGRRNKDVI